MSTHQENGNLHYLFLDLETTGLDDLRDEITEVGVAGTTADLEVLFAYNQVVAPSEAGLARLNANPFVTEMYNLNGLMVDIAAPNLPTLAEVEREVLDLITSHQPAPVNGKHQPAFMAGSGVSHFDIRFIRSQMTALEARLHYNTLDAGVLRIAYETWVGTDLTPVNKDKTHRALDDVYCHLNEARAFRAVFLDHAARVAAAA